jgi:hypothetical protein
MKASVRSGSIRYSTVSTRRPPSCSGESDGASALSADDGVMSSSSSRSWIRRSTSAITTTLLPAAYNRLCCTLSSVATWPQTAAPVALAPIRAIW